MKKNNEAPKINAKMTRSLPHIGDYILLALLPFVWVFICDNLGLSDNETPIRALMEIALAAIVLYSLYLAKKGELSAEKTVELIIAAGIVMRLGYMLYTSWAVRYHDVGTLDGDGHAAYILNNILEGHLPQTDPKNNQFYHPPLYHILSAMAIKLASILTRTSDYSSLLKYAAAVSCAASCFTLVFIQKIADALKIAKKYQLPIIAVAAFFPNFLLMGGRVNNDSLVTMFMVMSVYFTIKWFYQTDMKYVIALALSIGLGMMSKLSGATVAFFTGPVMLYKLYVGFKEKKPLPIIKQLAVFAVICFPLGLWYPIRNYILFDQPINYVLKMEPGTAVYTGNVAWHKRFLTAPVWEEFTQVYMQPNDDYNIFMIISRTAVFGEFEYGNVSAIVSVALYYANLALMILSFAAMIFVLIKDKTRDWFCKYSMAAVWLITLVSYISVNITHPASCTADTRYIPLAVVSSLMYLAKAYEISGKGGNKVLTVCANVTAVCAAAFAVLSCIMYA